jgi:hypothetical protein
MTSGNPHFDYLAYELILHNPAAIQHWITRAATRGLNALQVSAQVCFYAEDLLEDPARVATVRQICSNAHAAGLRVDIWTHEIAAVPDTLKDATGQVLFGDVLWRHLSDKYAQFFALVPDVDRLVLTCAETDHPVYRRGQFAGDDSPTDRLVELIRRMAGICAAHGKELIVRTFVYAPEEQTYMEAALSRVARAELPAPVWVMTKCVPHDWHSHYPLNPLLGRAGGLPEIVELDLCQEFTGLGMLPYCYPDFVQFVLQQSRARGVRGVAARGEWPGGTGPHNLNEINLHAYERLVADPDQPVTAIWRDWTTARYGATAADTVTRALRRSCEIVDAIYWPRGAWLSDHSQLPSWGYAYSHLENNSPARWIASHPQLRTREALLHPDEFVIAELRAEKDIARQRCAAAKRDLETVRQRLTAAQFAELAGAFDLCATGLQLAVAHHEAFFQSLRYIRLVEKDDATASAARQDTQAAVAQLRAVAQPVVDRVGPRALPFRPGRCLELADFIMAAILDGDPRAAIAAATAGMGWKPRIPVAARVAESLPA